jgi:hypothetical protein
MSDNPQQQDPQQDPPSSDVAAREQQLLEAFKNGLPRGPDGLIDFNAAVQLLIQHGADVPTVMIIIRLAEEKQREMMQQMQDAAPKMASFGGSLGGRPRSSVVEFPPNRRSGTAPWREKR